MEKRKRNDRITLPVLNSMLHHTLEDDVYVDGESFALLLEIQRTLAVFEPIGDDEGVIELPFVEDCDKGYQCWSGGLDILSRKRVEIL